MVAASSLHLKRDQGRLAALSLWPVFSFASQHDEFPLFNQRPAPVDACCALVGPTTAAALRRGFDEETMHRMLRFLFASRGEFRWRTVRRALGSHELRS